MEQIQVLTEEKFKGIYTNEKLRNAVAFAHGCFNKNMQFSYKKALMYPINYKVTEEQIKKAVNLRIKKQKEVLKDNYNNLLFCGMGMNFKPTIKDGVENHRIRTEFLNKDGIKCFIEVGTGRTPEENLRVDFALYGYIENETKNEKNQYNYKKLETETPTLKYTYENVLNLVNKYFNCNFKKMVVDNYNISCESVLCKSPK